MRLDIYRNRFEEINPRGTRREETRRMLFTVHIFHCIFIHKSPNGEFSPVATVLNNEARIHAIL